EAGPDIARRLRVDESVTVSRTRYVFRGDGKARRQLGMPLSRWRIWVRLRRAAEAMRAGQSPADAALTGGFADQAHFTRRLREMMGLTPAAVAPLLRRSAAAGDVHRDGARDR
ncbi:helix-turn-helix domain-containing protein, partial [Nonomuraea sp. NPDC055795]